VRTGIHMALVTASESRSGQRDVYVPATERGMAHHSYLSPDEKNVLLTEMAAEGWLQCRVVPFDGNARGVAVGPPHGRCTGGAWSRDGKWLFLSVTREDGTHLWRQRFPGGQPEQMTFAPTEQDGVAMAPDGESLYTAVGNDRSTIWLSRPGEEDVQVSGEGNSTHPTFSPDGKTLYYLRRTAATPVFVEGYLMAVDLANMQRESLFPDLVVRDFHISPDGKRVAFSQMGKDGDLEVWIARLDRRAPPQRVSSPTPIDQPLFGDNDRLYFRALEGERHYLETSRLDGTERKRLMPMVFLGGISPDRKWLVVSLPADEEDSSLRTVAYAVDGSRSVPLCIYCNINWSPDGKTIHMAMGTSMRSLQALSLPTKPGSMLPELPPHGLLSIQEGEKLPGAKVVQSGTVIGPGEGPSSQISPDARATAYLKNATQRNIYRIPLR
jgi:Tol biopolymer transport system component